MWSIGVIAFQLFTGSRPFEGSVKQIFKDCINKPMHQVLNPTISTTNSNGGSARSVPKNIWKKATYEAKDLVACLLNRNVGMRLSAEEAAKHPFFTVRHAPRQGQPSLTALLA